MAKSRWLRIQSVNRVFALTLTLDNAKEEGQTGSLWFPVALKRGEIYARYGIVMPAPCYLILGPTTEIGLPPSIHSLLFSHCQIHATRRAIANLNASGF